MPCKLSALTRTLAALQVGLNLSNCQPTTCVDALIEAAAAAAGDAASGSAGAAADAQQQQQQQQEADGTQQQQQQTRRQQLEPVRREQLLAGILSRLEPMLERLATEGFGPFEAEYCRHWLHSDQQVRAWSFNFGFGRRAGTWWGRGECAAQAMPAIFMRKPCQPCPCPFGTCA